MLTITIRDAGFEIRGHANYDEYGKDIVCSAVSFLAQSMTEELKKYVHTHEIIESGYMDVFLLTKSHESDVLFSFFKESMLQLSQAYPENVQVVQKTQINK